MIYMYMEVASLAQKTGQLYTFSSLMMHLVPKDNSFKSIFKRPPRLQFSVFGGPLRTIIIIIIVSKLSGLKIKCINV